MPARTPSRDRPAGILENGLEVQTEQAMPIVLLLEDEPLARWVARKALEEAGVEVVETASCEEACRLVDQERFTAAVLDYRLPDGNGLDVARHLRGKESGGAIFMLTAEGDQLGSAELDELGIAVVLDKPLDIPALHEALQAALSAAPMEHPDGADPDGETSGKWIGRFRVIACGQADEEAVAGIHPTAADGGWLALDWRKAGQAGAAACAELKALAGRCREAGGRLALLAAGDAPFGELLEAAGAQREFDWVVSERQLDALSRRPTSYCERASLLSAMEEAGAGRATP